MKASLFTTSLSTGLIFAGSVWADVTPEDVWADFENMMSSMGMTLNAAPVRDGDALIARDVTYEMSFGTALADMTAVTTLSRFFRWAKFGAVIVNVRRPHPVPSIGGVAPTAVQIAA